jgi:urease accessory protein
MARTALSRLPLSQMTVGALTLLTPAMAFAHTGVGDAGGFAHGFMHPVTGLDHVLAMVMVGVLASQMNGRALWLVPAAFVLVMAAGGALGVAGIGVPFVETGIALSVVVLGAMVAFGIRLPAAAAMAVVALFAIFHGHAHGTEMPANAAGLAYGLGFMLGTALLHLAGIAAGMLVGSASRNRGQALVRATGGIAALAGVAILSGLV